MARLRWSALALVAFLATAARAEAHPLGNFTINHLARLTVERDRVRVSYALDEAEIPSFAVLRALDRRAAPASSQLAGWAHRTALEAARDLALTIDGRPRSLVLHDVSVTTRPGAGGLQTIALRADYETPRPPGAHRLALRDGTFAGRIGWRDVVVGGEREPTDALRRYPAALLGSPRDRTARVAFVGPDGVLRGADDAEAADASAPRPALARNDALAQALARGDGAPLVVLGALLLAVCLGALHALEPGHGKTLLAVSLVGARATVLQALILAASLTLAHTFGVIVFGIAVLVFARWIVPEAIYPWLTLGSGLVVVALGARALAHEIAHHAHRHAHAHPHVHAAFSFRTALLAAVSGNVAPCPAALVVLLAAIALHRVAYGLAVIVAFSVGLALVLTGLGIAVVRGSARLAAAPRFARLARFGPLATATIISAIGASILAQALVQQGIAAPVPVLAALILTATAGYALSRSHHAHSHAHAPLIEGEPL